MWERSDIVTDKVLRKLICLSCENKYVQISRTPGCWGDPIMVNDDPKINWQDFINNQQHHHAQASITEIFRTSIKEAFPELDINEFNFSTLLSQNTDEAMAVDFRFNNWDFFNKIKHKGGIQVVNSLEVADRILANIPKDPHFRIQKNVSRTHSYLDVYLQNSPRKS